MKYLEVEFKYKADNITLTNFHKFCGDRNPERYVFASGYDYFYDSTKDQEAFCRHRTGPDVNQLTFKRKTADANNFIRTEHNIELRKGTEEHAVEALLKEFGYKINSSIFKTCFVYVYDYYVLVYYICYDLDMVEKSRFIEIEMREDYAWANESEAWNSLTAMERICKPLGITAQARIKKSLYEIFKEEKL